MPFLKPQLCTPISPSHPHARAWYKAFPSPTAGKGAEHPPWPLAISSLACPHHRGQRRGDQGGGRKPFRSPWEHKRLFNRCQRRLLGNALLMATERKEGEKAAIPPLLGGWAPAPGHPAHVLPAPDGWTDWAPSLPRLRAVEGAGLPPLPTCPPPSSPAFSFPSPLGVCTPPCSLASLFRSCRRCRPHCRPHCRLSCQPVSPLAFPSLGFGSLGPAPGS